MTLDTEVGSETVMGVFGGDQALEMGIWLINRHAFVLLLLSCAATNFLFVLGFAARPTKFSASASFSAPDASFNDLRGCICLRRDANTEAYDRTGEGLDLRAEDVPTLRDGEARE